MTSLALVTADRPPDDPALATAFHAGLIDILNNEARNERGWSGSVITDYGKQGGIAFLRIEPGEQFATIDDLRTFREAQRAARERDDQHADQPQLL